MAVLLFKGKLRYFYPMQEETLTPEKGCLLLAEPYLGDPNFERSVVLLVEYSAEGAVGFVLSQPMGILPHDVVSRFPEFASEVFMGGPVEKNHLYFLHTRPDLFPEAIPVDGHLYWGGHFDALRAAVEQGAIHPHDIRFFIGYSGWSAGQLEEELQQGSWRILMPHGWNVLEVNPESLWSEGMTRLGQEGLLWAHAPEDPLLN
jgi:putative transcriptional regulator